MFWGAFGEGEGGANLLTTAGTLILRLGLGLATYYLVSRSQTLHGMMIATLAVDRDPMIRLLDRWKTVSH